jgi:hypothetical protein
MVLALALLAGLKVWAQDSVYRSATEQAIISAYRDRAIVACQRQPLKDARGHTPLTAVWANPSSIKLVIGNSALSVSIWEIDHQLWDARYKNLYLLLSAGEQASLVCTYDIGLGTAGLSHA